MVFFLEETTALGIDVRNVTACEMGVKRAETQLTLNDIFQWNDDVFVTACFFVRFPR